MAVSRLCCCSEPFPNISVYKNLFWFDMHHIILYYKLLCFRLCFCLFFKKDFVPMFCWCCLFNLCLFFSSFWESQSPVHGPEQCVE